LEDPSTHQPESLTRRSDASAVKIEDLLADVRRGRVRVPSFQRPFKWVRKDAQDLLDSLYRGYPVGTLLFWETIAEAGVMQFGSVRVSGDARPDGLWVVDGQQRIVSLVRVLLAAPPQSPSDAPDDFALYFDLEKRQFIPPPAPDALQSDPSRWLPMTSVLDSEHLLQWTFAHSQGAPAQRRETAFQLGKRIREYEIPAYYVRTDNESTLREIFGRANSKGKRLEANEVFEALHSSRGAQRPASLAQVADELTDTHFGRVEDKILYRLLRVLHGADVSERSGDGPLRLGTEESLLAYATTASAARSAVQFLKGPAGIGHYKLLPYKQPLVTLGQFFHHHPTPSPRSRELLVRWLWRGALNGSHLGDTVSSRRALALINPADESASVQAMLAMVGQRPKATPQAEAPFHFRHAAGKLLALAMIDLEPRSLLNGEILSLTELLEDTAGTEAAPFPTLLHAARLPPALGRSAANRVAHPAATGLRTHLLKVSDENVLRSHGINSLAFEALRAGNLPSFLSQRSRFLASYAAHFFLKRARWDETDRPALNALVVSEEAD
jgi:hypothetical protein